MQPSQSIIDGVFTQVVSKIFGGSPLETTMAQAVGIQTKAAGVAITGEKGVELARASKEAREITDSWALDDPLKIAMEGMLITLMESTGTIAKQAADAKLPR